MSNGVLPTSKENSTTPKLHTSACSASYALPKHYA